MKRSVIPAALVTLMLVFAATAMPASAQPGGDVRVTVGSPSGPFSANKQNEPAVAVDQAHPNVLAAGSNDNIDMESCNAGSDLTCPFTGGVGVSGIYFSFDSGANWTQPTYTGLSARGCTGAVGEADPDCVPQVGPIGTLPNYYEKGLKSDGDPAVAFGPAPGPWRVQLRERVAPVLRQPGLGGPRPRPVQWVRGDRRVPHGRRCGCGCGRWRRMERSGHRLEAELRPLFRQGAGVGR